MHEVSVRHDSQGNGLGRRLVEAAMEYAQSEGLRCVTLTTFAEVPWNAPFYERLGFCIEGDEYLEAGIPHVLMVRHSD